MPDLLDERGQEAGSIEIANVNGAVNRKRVAPAARPYLDASVPRPRALFSTSEQRCHLAFQACRIADVDELIVERQDEAWHRYNRPPSAVGPEANWRSGRP